MLSPGDPLLFLLDLRDDLPDRGVVEIHVGDSGEERLFHQRVGLFGGIPVLSRPGKSDERADDLVLVICGVGFLSAHACLSLAAGVVSCLLTLEAKHILHVDQVPFCYKMYPESISVPCYYFRTEGFNTTDHITDGIFFMRNKVT